MHLIHGNKPVFGDVLYPMLRFRVDTQKEWPDDTHALFYQEIRSFAIPPLSASA